MNPGNQEIAQATNSLQGSKVVGIEMLNKLRNQRIASNVAAQPEPSMEKPNSLFNFNQSGAGSLAPSIDSSDSFNSNPFAKVDPFPVVVNTQEPFTNPFQTSDSQETTPRAFPDNVVPFTKAETSPQADNGETFSEQISPTPKATQEVTPETQTNLAAATSEQVNRTVIDSQSAQKSTVKAEEIKSEATNNPVEKVFKKMSLGRAISSISATKNPHGIEDLLQPDLKNNASANLAA